MNPRVGRNLQGLDWTVVAGEPSTVTVTIPGGVQGTWTAVTRDLVVDAVPVDESTFTLTLPADPAIVGSPVALHQDASQRTAGFILTARSDRPALAAVTVTVGDADLLELTITGTDLPAIIDGGTP